MANVLVVEDDLAIARLLEATLRISGHVVRIAPHLQDALDAVRENWADVVTLDLNLRGQDGSLVLTAARTHHSVAKFLIVSAYGAEAACLKLGADGWVQKPFDPLTVNRKVDELVAVAQPSEVD